MRRKYKIVYYVQIKDHWFLTGLRKWVHADNIPKKHNGFGSHRAYKGKNAKRKCWAAALYHVRSGKDVTVAKQYYWKGRRVFDDYEYCPARDGKR